MRKEKVVRKMFTDSLPKHKEGIYKNKINWQESVGYKVKFQYKDIKSEVEIISFNKENRLLSIKYLDKEPFKITTSDFSNCCLGKLLGKITNEFKIEIGTRFCDEKRDLIILDREYREKIKKDGKKQYWRWYKYHCNKCGYEDWKVENGLFRGDGCSACCPNPSIPALGFNTIWDTDRWMCDLGISEEDAKKYTHGSMKKIFVTCPDCGRIKSIEINKINYYHSIFCKCSDTISYPNKFCFALLEQLKIDFISEYSPEWVSPKRYDFYFELNNKKWIVEMDGNLGHGNRDNNMNGQTKEESQAIDNYKDKLADNYDIQVIRIDCRRSELEYIKNNILNSELNDLFDFNNIDWLKCHEFALSNLVKKACEIKRDNPKITTKQIGKIMNLNHQTITRYLKKGTRLGWCDYNPKEEMIKSNKNNGKLHGKLVEVFKNGTSLGKFLSCVDLERQSEEKFGVKLIHQAISNVCLGKLRQYKGFTFKYIN